MSDMTLNTNPFKTAFTPAELAGLRKFVPAGREEVVDAVFAEAPKHGIDPWLVAGILHVEGHFGKALTKGEYKGKTVWTGDFIPRPATAGINAYMAKYPLPGCEKVPWSRPKIGNLPAVSGQMWVPAHDIRVQRFGATGARAKNGGIEGGLGWGWTPFQLDWRWHPAAIESGAIESTEGAIGYAIKQIIAPNIASAKRRGLKGDALVRAVVGSYNAGAKAIDAAAAGKDVGTVTAHPGYVDHVLAVAKAAGKTVTV
jgi:hypothetical protein